MYCICTLYSENSLYFISAMKELPRLFSFYRKIHTRLFSTTRVHFSANNPSVSEILYNRISHLGNNLNVSVVPVLDRWIAQQHSSLKRELRKTINQLRVQRRFKHALEVSIWMTNKQQFPVEPFDVAVRLKLIFENFGLERVENHFNKIPEKMKTYEVYLALLNCYTVARSVDKAEAIMQKARDSGYACKPIWYNLMMKLHYQLGNSKGVEDLLIEMGKKGISYDYFTLSLCLSACALNSDIAGIDKVVSIMKSDPQAFLNWKTCVTAAESYLKVGVTDKALEMLRKLEVQLTGTKKDDVVFVFLLKLYAEAGKKDELYRIWNLSKQNRRIVNRVYGQMLRSLMIFNDIEGVEKIFEEWESNALNYDFLIPHTLIGSYCKDGHLEKAEVLLAKEISKGGHPTVTTWCYFAGGYLKKNEVPKAVEALKKAILVCPAICISQKDNLITCLEYLENGDCLEKVEELIKCVGVSWFPKNLAPLDAYGEMKDEEFQSCGQNSISG